MSKMIYVIFLGTIFLTCSHLCSQETENCFLEDFEPRTAEIPQSIAAEKPVEPASAIVTINNDTLGKVSKYVFGNAIAAWAGAHDNPELVEGVKRLSPSLIRFPGGSWSNGYFWDGLTSDLPDSIYDGTTYNTTTKTAKKIKFWGQTGKGGWQTTTTQYYALRKKTDVTQGLITINYGYARYGLSDDPVAQAAHLAANWVRYDNGHTRFWEIGNENGGPWEYGWMIDTELNKDGQSQIITGELYGKHFKVFADSMRKAAAEIGATIYIGGQVVIDGPTSWNFVDRDWNEGFFREVGDYADFYVIHNYFSSSNNVIGILNYAVTEPKRDMEYLKRDFINRNAFPKPIALTEYNMGGGTVERAVSYINGIQAVILMCELIENNYGLGARWLLISGEATMFYGGSDSRYVNHPHAEFYYLTFLQKFYGDHAVTTESSNRDILCYASTFSSGETSVIIVNKGTEDQVVVVDMQSIGVGQNYYVYSFTGEPDGGNFTPNVYINGEGPSSSYHWGPYDQLFDLKANSYAIDGEIKLKSPGGSVQMILIEGGNNIVSVNDESNSTIYSHKLYQNYPNPFNPSTHIDYQLPSNEFVTLKVFDILGKQVATLVNEQQNAGHYSVQFDASTLPSGVYVYRIDAGAFHETKKLSLFK